MRWLEGVGAVGLIKFGRSMLPLWGALAATQAAAVDFLPAQKLSQTVNTAVEPCPKTLETVTLPLITWGADLVTIQANGSQAETAPQSAFGAAGLKFRLQREDRFATQLASYLKCKTPYLRGTLAMVYAAAEVANKDPRTKLKIIHQLSWSAGGDAVVVREGIKSPADLKGKRVALQASGPHMDYLGKILSDAGLSPKDVKVKWVKDLTGSDQTPGAALAKGEADAALVIIPDALALTSGGAVGTGAESSVKGASIMLSTKSANRIIADVYAVRSDWFEAHRAEVGALVQALLEAEAATKALVKAKDSRKDEYRTLMKAGAGLLFDSESAVADAEAVYADAELAGWASNRSFFADAAWPRRFEVVAEEIRRTLMEMDLLSAGKLPLEHAGWDYEALKSGKVSVAADASRFNEEEVAKVVTRRQAQGTLDTGSLFAFEVFFKPNQNDFPQDLYQKDFIKVIDLAATYGGAIITIEGHSDPLGYLKQQKAGASELVLKQVRQSARNLSMTRANAVRDSLIGYAKSKGVTLDPAQFAVVGHGIERPASGMCGKDPCAPKTEKDWLNNMRVEFRLVQVEAESTVFKPL